MQQKLFTNLKKSLRKKKSDIAWLAYYQVKYFRSLDIKNDLLMIWFQNLK